MARKTIIDSIQKITERVLNRDDVPVSATAVPEVADAVTRAVAPVVQNATNTEPWYRSRIYLGLLAAGLGIFLSRFGIVITGDDLGTILDVGGEVISGVGVLYATYGRIVGASKPPLGAKKL